MFQLQWETTDSDVFSIISFDAKDTAKNGEIQLKEYSQLAHNDERKKML